MVKFLLPAVTTKLNGPSYFIAPTKSNRRLQKKTLNLVVIDLMSLEHSVYLFETDDGGDAETFSKVRYLLIYSSYVFQLFPNNCLQGRKNLITGKKFMTNNGLGQNDKIRLDQYR